MPESFGKRQRRDVTARKAAAREERRIARNKRREDRATGVLAPGAPLAEPEPDDDFSDVPAPDSGPGES
jgi:hypothetical protein